MNGWKQLDWLISSCFDIHTHTHVCVVCVYNDAYSLLDKPKMVKKIVDEPLPERWYFVCDRDKNRDE